MKLRETYDRVIAWMLLTWHHIVISYRRAHVRFDQWWYWQRHYMLMPIPIKINERVALQFTCPTCGCAYDLARLGIRNSNRQATVLCHCGNVLELKPHQHLGWMAPATIVRDHIHPPSVQ